MYFLGVDGGGTKTEFTIIDRSGNVLGHTIMPSCHFRQVGFEGFEEIIRNGISKVCFSADITTRDLTNSFLGIPGYGEDKEIQDKLYNIVQRIFIGSSFSCGNDSMAGWAGSLACQPGINIVAGTGSIGIGVRGNRTARAGGFGPFCGDEGSAYWLGKKVIELFSKEADGRLETSPIYHIVKEELKLSNAFDIISLVVEIYKMDRDKVAALANYMYRAALEGDKNAIEAYSAAAFELWLLSDAVAWELGFSNEDRFLISYSGGVFKAGDFIIEPFRNLIMEKYKNAEIITPILNPTSGATLYAIYNKVGILEKSVIDRLINEEKRLCL